MRNHARIQCAAAAVVIATTLASTAHAQTAGAFALDRFNPSERGSDWFALDSLDLRGNLRPAIGVVGDYGYRPLVLYNADGSVRTPLVNDQLIVHLGAALNLWDRLRVGFDLPIAAWQSGTSGTTNGITYPAGDSAGVGDLRLSADVRLFGTYGQAFTLAAGLQAFLPTGKRSDYLGDGSVRLLPRVQAAGDVARFTYAASLGFHYHADDEAFGAYVRGSEIVFGASAGVRALNHRFIIGPEVYGSTDVTDSGAFFSKRQTPVEAILGAHYAVTPDWRVGLGAGVGLTRGFGEPVARVLTSVEWVPAVKKAEPPLPPPPPPSDRDHDGILDLDDACPDVPGIATDNPLTNGCPPDRDHDGVLDSDDACPDLPGVKTTDPKTNGCPLDTDRDGIYDTDDACPEVAGVKTDDPKTNGCPPADPDRDKDGIPNDADACPDEAGPPDPDPKRNGCPKAFVRGNEIKILDQVKFATGSAAIVPGKESSDVLNAVLKILLEHPAITKMTVEGHTDNVGGADYNKTLSANRAASVVTWLVQHGIDKSRLKSVGWGKERPIDTNGTPEGRKNNRRVEFHLDQASSADEVKENDG